MQSYERKQDCGADPEDIAALLKRLQGEGKKPVCLLSRTESVEGVNCTMLEKEGIKPEFMHALDCNKSRRRMKGKGSAHPKPPSRKSAQDSLEYLKANTDRKTSLTGGLQQVLVLGLGARVMLKKNINVSLGLFNGAMGTVSRFHRRASKPDQVSSVMVKFDINPAVEVEIERHGTTFKLGPVQVKLL